MYPGVPLGIRWPLRLSLCGLVVSGVWRRRDGLGYLTEQQMQPLPTSIHSVISCPSWLTVRGFSMSVALEWVVSWWWVCAWIGGYFRLFGRFCFLIMLEQSITLTVSKFYYLFSNEASCVSTSRHTIHDHGNLFAMFLGQNIIE